MLFAGAVAGVFVIPCSSMKAMTFPKVWDGDDYEETSFTRLIPQYLRSRDNGRVVAFRLAVA